MHTEDKDEEPYDPLDESTEPSGPDDEQGPAKEAEATHDVTMAPPGGAGASDDKSPPGKDAKAKVVEEEPQELSQHSSEGPADAPPQERTQHNAMGSAGEPQ